MSADTPGTGAAYRAAMDGAVLAALEHFHGASTANEIGVHLNLPTDRVLHALRRLSRAGLAHYTGAGGVWAALGQRKTDA